VNDNMTKNIPKKFRLIRIGKIIRQGNSTVITIPAHFVKTIGIEVGDKVNVYSDGDGLMLVDLKPGEG